MTSGIHKLLGFDRFDRYSSFEEFEEHLEHVLSDGVYVHHENGEALLIFGRALVDKIQGPRIEIRPKEHAPPHFHVLGQGIDASFAISDGSLLAGKPDRRQAEVIQYWYRYAKPHLIRIWNETRPSNCPVGHFNDA